MFDQKSLPELAFESRARELSHEELDTVAGGSDYGTFSTGPGGIVVDVGDEDAY